MEQHEETHAHEGDKHEKHPAHPVKHAKVRHPVVVPQDNWVASPEEGPPAPGPFLPADAPPAPVQNTVASVGVPATATDELAKLIPANGQITGLTVVLAAVAVLGGGAAWKFYRQRSREQHEQKMKELELNAAQSQTQHPSCKAENAAIQEELRKLNATVGSMNATVGNLPQSVADVANRVAKLEARVESPDLPEDFDDLENRVKKLERAVKPPRGKTKT